MRPQRRDLAEAALGFLHPEDGPFLRSLALGCPGPYLEVGSYCGKSTIWIGDAAETNGTILVAVDHHQGSPEMAPGKNCHNPSVIDADGTHDTLPIFRRNIRRAGLQDVVVPLVAPTLVASQIWTAPVGFVFIDGAHDEGVQDDADGWAPHVRPGGLMAFHDTPIPVIGKAVDSLIERGWVEQSPSRTIRVVRKP